MSQNLVFQNAATTQNVVSDKLFGANALHAINVDDLRTPSETFAKSLIDLGVTNIRYPGGFMEGLGDLLVNSTAEELDPKLVEFLDWVKEQRAQGMEYTVTLGIPTKSSVDDLVNSLEYGSKIKDFAKHIAQDYAGIVTAIEIGNEYSIGSDTLSEIDYGFRADIAAQALAEGFESSGLSGDNQPDILIQMAEIFGGGSDYRVTGNHMQANKDIVQALSAKSIEAIDGVVNHYYYTKKHDGDDGFAEINNDGGQKLETRFLFDKIDAWKENWASVSPKDLDLHFTEWNIQKNNADQLGLKSASTLLKQFEYMLEMGVDGAHAWPVQHKTPNALSGNPNGTGNPKPAGARFQLLSQELGQPKRQKL